MKGTVTATIKPKEDADDVGFSTNKAERATVVEDKRVTTADAVIVTLKVSGLTETPADKKDGDTDLEANCRKHKTKLATAKIIVIFPKTQVHTNPEATLTNAAKNIVNGTKAELTSSGSVVHGITISDQFGQTLDSLYDGDMVVSETFKDKIEKGLTRFPQDGDFGNLSSGRTDDRTAITSPLIGTPLSEEQIADWVAKKPDPLGVGANTVWRLMKMNGAFPDSAGSATQEISVHGHKVTPDYVRINMLSSENYPPVPFDSRDTAK